jgi:predicted MFS family arabinose efflux permease
MFSSGSLGTLISGYIADKYGFITVFYSTAAICLAGAAAALFLRKENQ